MKAVQVSIIIPCHSVDYGLEATLLALHDQDFQGTFEIVVGNDGDDSQVRDLCEKLGARSIPVHPAGSSYRARNRAIEHAAGEFLGFTDANKIPRRDWVSTGYAQLSSGRPYVGGRIEILPSPQWGPDSSYWYQVYRGLPNEQYITADSFAVTGNLFVQKEVLRVAGPFADGAVSGGDYEWGRRVASHGFRQDYCSELVVFHGARNREQLVKKQLRTMEGHLRRSSPTDLLLRRTISWRRILKVLLPPKPLVLNRLPRSHLTVAIRLRVLLVALHLGFMAANQLFLWKVYGYKRSRRYY